MRGHIAASLVVVATVLALVPTGAAAQGVERSGETWVTPRTPWGDPDLQGIWNNSTTTPVQRPVELGEKEFWTEEEVLARDEQVGEQRNTDREPRAGDPGTYNEFWWERGSTAVNARTSLIVDPRNGRAPALTSEGQRRADAMAKRREERGEYFSYEDRPLAERCIIYRGVPPFPTGYNNNYHILQTPEYVAIVQEHIHDFRIIPLDGRPHADGKIEQWLGDSRAHWDGDTLVVETTNFSDNALIRGGIQGDPSPALRVVERYTRVTEDIIDYQFTVEDPRTWTRPWSGVIPMVWNEGPMYEYACHEGNYALGNVLAGARQLEAESSGAAGSK